MYYYYEVALFGNPDFLLTYKSDKLYSVGSKVCVPLAKRQVTGIIWKKVSSPGFSGKLASIKALSDDAVVLSGNNLAFYDFCAQYYHTPLPLVLKAAFPQKSQTGSLIEAELPTLHQGMSDTQISLQPNAQQLKFIQKVNIYAFQTYLLDGVTGSGKTFCYSQVIEKVIKENKNVLVLVPEISLVTNMSAQLLELSLGPIICYHSQISATDKAVIFNKSGQLTGHIIITTRSGIFLPLEQLGLIIVDEEHDSSFKEENRSEQFFGFKNTFFYNARDLAIKKAQINQCPCILGSATPSLQSLQNAQRKAFSYSQLLKRATEQKVPTIEVVETIKPTWKTPLDPKVLLEIKSVLDSDKQVLIYLNQRGYIPNLYCKNCQKSLQCPTCSSKVVIHEDKKQAHCHHCCKKISYQPTCPDCHEPWVYCGFGTQRLKEYLAEVFPLEEITLIDTDHMTTAKKLSDTLKKVTKQKSGIIVGTQMVCKGHNWPNIALSVILVGHYQLEQSIDERVAQNIVQVAGRAGRFDKGRALMPYPMDTPVDNKLQALLAGNYYEWIKAYNYQLGDITTLKYAKVNIRTQNLDKCLAQIAGIIKALLSNEIEGPILDYPAHVGKYWKVYLVIQSPSYKGRDKTLQTFLDLLKPLSSIIKELSVDIDPLQIDML